MTGEGFFHIDRRIWKLLCDRQSMNMAVAYLCIATGTGGGNRTSFWSAQAVEKYTGLHNTRATAAIGELIAADFVRRGEESRRTRPLYELQTYPTIVEAMLKAACVDETLECAMERVRKDLNMSSVDRRRADRLVDMGVMWRVGNRYSLDPPQVESAAELIWLPNTLVTGAQSEASPVKRVRSRGDIWALRLLIDLYHAQNLSADGGINREVLRFEYERKKYGQRGHHVVWGFTARKGFAYPHSSTKPFWDRKAAERLERVPIWEAVETLTSMGLLVVVPHLVENAGATCEPIHGYGWGGAGELLEQNLGDAADEAARYMLGEERLYTAETIDGVEMMAPVWETQANVQMVGVFRLTYRPHTRLTSDWYRRMNEKAEEWLETYKRLGPQDELPVASGFSR
jgi:hypothetical protein